MYLNFTLLLLLCWYLLYVTTTGHKTS